MKRNRLLMLIWIWINSVQVSSDQIASLVPNDNPIWIDHWNDIKQASISQLSCNIWLPNQEVDESMQNPTWIRFSWMDSATHNNDFLLDGFLVDHKLICLNKWIIALPSLSFSKIFTWLFQQVIFFWKISDF